MQLLKQSTQVKVTIGPLVDAADGFTPETGITLGAADVASVMKHDGGGLTSISANTFSHLSNGVYNLTLTTSDTNTLGMLTFHLIDFSIMRPFRLDFMVVPANIYDSMIADTDKLDVNVAQISEDSTAADSLEAAVEGVVSGTVGSGSSTSVIATNLTEATNDHYNGRTIVFRAGALAGQASQITDYNGTTKEITCNTLTEAPSNGDTFVIV